MIVQKITLNGFKSFAKRTEIDLNFPIVALVGPNGSGKSNVADGIRWVLGEQGTKNLRASKQEDVIFAGSATKQPKGMAEVKLQFDNGTQFFDVPWAELELGRVLYRDGQGEYLMNNNKVLHRELAEVLAKSGLGSFDLTVIGQGEIDQILIMGSKEIQSLLEDASGVKPFYMKKARIVNNLRGTSENTKRLQDILGELEPRLQILKKESKQAQDYLEIKENLAIKQKAWYQLQLQKIDQDIASLSKTSTLFDAKRSEIHAQIEAKEAETKVLSSALINRQGDLQNISRRIESLQEELNEYWQEQAGIQAKLELNRSQLAPINTDKGGDSATLVKQEDELGAELKALEKQIVTGESQEEHVKEQLQKVMLNYQKTIDQLNEQSQKQSAGAGRALVKSKFGEVRSLYDKLSEKLFGKSLPLQELKRAFDEGKHLHQRIQPLLDEVDKLMEQDESGNQDELKAMRAKVQELYEQSQQLQAQVTQVAGQLGVLRNSRSQVQSKLQQISSQLAQQENAKGGARPEMTAALRKEQQFLQSQERELQRRIGSLEFKIQTEKQKMTGMLSQEQENKQMAELRFAVVQLNQKLGQLRMQEQEILVQRTRLETRKEDTVLRAKQEFGLTDEEILQLRADAMVGDGEMVQIVNQETLTSLENEIMSQKHKLDRIGEVNQKAPAEYEEVKGRFDWLYQHLKDIEQTAKFLELKLKELDQFIENLFDQVFSETQRRFSEYFALLFEGGEGKLERWINVFGEKEIVIRAKPPGKRMHDLNLLSGGERSLGAVALLFAILETCKTPFCILDEVDAALDEANVGRFCEALKRLNQSSQIILVTHNKRTMEVADCLYGATMEEDGTTQIVSLKLQDYLKKTG